MTRETKIGLLVGLAFIIVIGILLSDHLTSTTEPPQARLTQAGSNVRQGVSIPGAPTANPPVTSVINPSPVAPQQPIPTKDDLTPRPQPVQIVQIGPSAHGAVAPQATHQPPITLAPPTAAPVLIAQQPREQHLPLENPIVPQETPLPDATPAEGPLTQLANQIGEEIIDLTSPPPAAPESNPSGAPALAGGKPYKAQSGDTLSKMAGRFLGENTKANRDAIIQANPSLAKNPDIVVVGKTYIIPTTADAAAAVTSNSPGLPIPSPTPEYWYTVKPNDSLRKIAANQLGDEEAWAAIQDLNKNTLKGDDKTVVIPGMKLRLPGRPIAAAN